jgi:hypothetical protein
MKKSELRQIIRECLIEQHKKQKLNEGFINKTNITFNAFINSLTSISKLSQFIGNAIDGKVVDTQVKKDIMSNIKKDEEMVSLISQRKKLSNTYNSTTGRGSTKIKAELKPQIADIDNKILNKLKTSIKSDEGKKVLNSIYRELKGYKT